MTIQSFHHKSHFQAGNDTFKKHHDYNEAKPQGTCLRVTLSQEKALNSRTKLRRVEKEPTAITELSLR